MSEERSIGAIATAVVAVVALVLAGGALITSAGATGAATPAAAAGDAPASAAVELSEFAISPATITVAAGGRLEVTNAGSAEHDLSVEGADLATPRATRA